MEHQQNTCHHAGHTRSSGVWWTKISLRLLSILLSIATIGVSAFYATNGTIGALIMLGPPTGAATLWDLVEVLYLIIHTNSNGIHPNACIIIDLILFLAFTAMSSVIAFTAANLSDSGWYFAFFQNEQDVEYLRIAAGFGFMTAVVHFLMIVVAWRELKKQPSSDRNDGPQIIYVERGQYPPAASSEIDPPPAYSKASQPDESQKP